MNRPHFSILACVLCLLPHDALSHGIVGDRYFPPTVEVDDPFAANEMHAIAGRRPRSNSVPSTRSTTFTIGGGVEPVDGFGISLDATYLRPNGNISPPRDGFDNLLLTVKKELVISPAACGGQDSRVDGCDTH